MKYHTGKNAGCSRRKAVAGIVIRPRQTRVFSVEVINMFPYKNDESRNNTGNQGGAMNGTPGADHTQFQNQNPFNPGLKSRVSKNALHCAYGKEVRNA